MNSLLDQAVRNNGQQLDIGRNRFRTRELVAEWRGTTRVAGVSAEADADQTSG